MARRHSLIAAILVIVIRMLSTAQANDVLSEIERMVSIGERDDPSLAKAITDEIEKNPSVIIAGILPKLNNQNLTDNQAAVYVWALGLTRDKACAEAIKELYEKNKSLLVRGNCLRSLALIPDSKSDEFLLSALANSPDKEMRFHILNLLSELHCEAALPNTEEILKDRGFNWQCMFVFGKMGDTAIPFLLEKIRDTDPNIRTNAVHALGQLLVAPEATKSLQAQFWTEKDERLRGLILSSIEKTTTNLSELNTFFEDVAKKEQNGELLKFARETLDHMDMLKVELTKLAQQKSVSQSTFESEYQKLFKSAGKEGSYEILGVSSTVRDEPKLKALRERILQRNSDEAFYDFEKVNVIIMQNRLIEK